jgi:lipoprotein signal peptidase
VSVANTQTAINVINTAGIIVNVANTGGAYNLINTAGWVVSASATILNSANWVVSVANTGGAYSLINSAGWIVNVANTGGAVSVINTAGLSVNINSSTANTVLIDTDRMSSGGVAVTPAFATIVATATNNELVAPQANKRIRVVAYEMMAATAVNARFESGTADTVYLTGFKYLAASGGMVCPYNPVGWFQTNVGSSLNLELSAAANIGGSLTYLVL